jgi:class 3 adenylate cyclase
VTVSRDDVTVRPAQTPSTTPLSTAPVAAASTPEASGERRHVTVMFCDLVDSTGIAAKLDAEEWRDLVGAYLDAASAALAEMGGKVAKKSSAMGSWRCSAIRWHKRTMASGQCGRRCRSRARWPG